MAQLSKEDDRVVRKWWKCSSGVIFENGRFILDNEYRPSASTNCCKLVGNGRSFQSILRSAGVGNIWSCQSASAISDRDGSRVVLTVWEDPPTEIRVTSFDVHYRGFYTVLATPAVPPAPGPSPQRGGLRQQFRRLFR
ncbi:hypothetical protein V8E53_014572 [Lactarius tabidus]